MGTILLTTTKASEGALSFSTKPTENTIKSKKKNNNLYNRRCLQKVKNNRSIHIFASFAEGKKNRSWIPSSRIQCAISIIKLHAVWFYARLRDLVQLKASLTAKAFHNFRTCNWIKEHGSLGSYEIARRVSDHTTNTTTISGVLMPSCINILHSNTPNSGTCQWTSVQLIRWNLKIQYNLRTSEEGKSTKKKKKTPKF